MQEAALSVSSGAITRPKHWINSSLALLYMQSVLPVKKAPLTSSDTGPDDGVASALPFGGYPLRQLLYLNSVARSGARGVRWLKKMIKAVYSRMAALFVLLALAGCGAYRIPTLDGSGPTPSPPSLVGVVISASEHELLISPTSKGSPEASPVHVSIFEQTAVFTSYGGLIPVSELVVGKTVKVWFTKRRPPRVPALPVAAAVEVTEAPSGNHKWRVT
jgi:hypothetical protein